EQQSHLVMLNKSLAGLLVKSTHHSQSGRLNVHTVLHSLIYLSDLVGDGLWSMQSGTQCSQ
ncbi:MAG: hypothetical protein ABL873_07800, partial [Gallionella sp.]